MKIWWLNLPCFLYVLVPYLLLRPWLGLPRMGYSWTKSIDKGLVPALLDQKTFFGRCLIFLWPYNLLWLETFVLSRHSYVEIFLKCWQNSSNYEDMFQKSWEPVKLNHRLNTVLGKKMQFCRQTRVASIIT